MGASPYTHYVSRSSPLCGVKVPPAQKSSNLTASRGNRQKKQNKKTVPWLSSSRSERRVLQRRCQPTPTQPIYIIPIYTYIYCQVLVYNIGVRCCVWVSCLHLSSSNKAGPYSLRLDLYRLYLTGAAAFSCGRPPIPRAHQTCDSLTLARPCLRCCSTLWA